MKCRIFLAIFVLFVALLLYFLHTTFDMFTRDEYSSMSHCKVIETVRGPEDLQIFDNIIVSAYADRILYKDRGGILFISENGDIRKAYLEGYPENRSFNPLGLHILDSTLYLINVDVGGQQDTIEVFEIHKELGKHEVTYIKTIRFKQDYYNQLNDIFFINKNTFYITFYRPQPDFKSIGILEGLKFLVAKLTSVLKCNITNDLADCVIVDEGWMFNGLAKRKGELFAVDTLGKTVNIYKISKDASLEKLEEIHLGIAGDNIIYDERRDKFYVGVLRSNEFMAAGKDLAEGKMPKIAGGVAEIYLEKEKWKSKVLFMQKNISGLSSAVIFGKNMIMGSWVDNHILVCPLE